MWKLRSKHIKKETKNDQARIIGQRRHYSRPENSRAEEDFKQLAAAVDLYIEAHGKLDNILIYTETFPGWKDFTGLLSHLRFVKDHNRKIGKVAIVTDSKVATVAESLAKHFVSAQIKHFEFTAKTRTYLTMFFGNNALEPVTVQGDN